MPRKTPTLEAGKLADGVRIRAYPSGKMRLEVQFQFRNVQCREILSIPVTKANSQYAINLKHQIEEAKERKLFRYRDFFPHSPRCRQFGEIDLPDPTVNEAINQWLLDAQASHPHSTYRSYVKAARYCKEQLGTRKLTDLEFNPEPIRNMIRARHATLKTIRNDLIPLRAIFSQALEDDIVKRNPLDRIRVQKLANARTDSTYHIDPLALDDIMLFLKTAELVKPRWKNYFQFAFFSGLRTSELYALRWRDVNLAQCQVKISSAVVERKEKSTKTSASNRTIDLMPMAVAALAAEYSSQALAGKGREMWDFVFWNPVLKQPITDYDHSGRAWKYILNAAEIRYRNQYQTRHSYCSNLLSGGENLYYVAQQMGHADTEMIMKHYGKWIEHGQATRERRAFTSDFGNFSSS